MSRFCTGGRYVVLSLALLAGYGGAAVDPTRPPAQLRQESKQPGAMVVTARKLQSIRSLSGQRSAVINGQHVKVGSLIAGARVMKIEATQVELSIGGRTERLRLTAPMKKQRIK